MFLENALPESLPQDLTETFAQTSLTENQQTLVTKIVMEDGVLSEDEKKDIGIIGTYLKRLKDGESINYRSLAREAGSLSAIVYDKAFEIGGGAAIKAAEDLGSLAQYAPKEAPARFDKAFEIGGEVAIYAAENLWSLARYAPDEAPRRFDKAFEIGGDVAIFAAENLWSLARYAPDEAPRRFDKAFEIGGDVAMFAAARSLWSLARYAPDEAPRRFDKAFEIGGNVAIYAAGKLGSLAINMPDRAALLLSELKDLDCYKTEAGQETIDRIVTYIEDEKGIDVPGMGKTGGNLRVPVVNPPQPQ